MEPYLIAFITGLTTGGLSCLAVQGGLLASSVGRQLEQDLLNAPKGKKADHRPVTPIVLFLSAKVVAYTILGLLLGAFGSLLTLTPTLRAVLLIAIGIFMIGNALRMLNIHPIFRYFAIEPPRSITRAIRKRARNDNDPVTPLILGAMTVLIPCGVTQAMMAVAIASGSALEGAGIMLAFTLGTSPVFFLVAYLTTQLGARMEKLFMRFVAVVILVLGIVSIVSGMNLAGITTSLAGRDPEPVKIESRQPAQPGSPAPDLGSTGQGSENLVLDAKNNGYFPGVLVAKANKPVKLNIRTENTVSCAIAFVIPALGYETLLPPSGTTVVEIPAQNSGTVIPFTCSMGMYTGKIVFE